MPDRRDRILKALTPGVARLTVAADPDGLLLEAALLEAIRERGFEIVTFEDPVAFRFDHESRTRRSPAPRGSGVTGRHCKQAAGCWLERCGAGETADEGDGDGV